MLILHLMLLMFYISKRRLTKHKNAPSKQQCKDFDNTMFCTALIHPKAAILSSRVVSIKTCFYANVFS